MELVSLEDQASIDLDGGESFLTERRARKRAGRKRPKLSMPPLPKRSQQAAMDSPAGRAAVKAGVAAISKLAGL